MDNNERVLKRIGELLLQMDSYHPKDTTPPLLRQWIGPVNLSHIGFKYDADGDSNPTITIIGIPHIPLEATPEKPKYEEELTKLLILCRTFSETDVTDIVQHKLCKEI